jgi:putative tricarboxylic transport membrane protein
MIDRVIIVCTVIIAVLYFYGTAQIPTLQIGDPLGPKAFPILLGIALLISVGLLGVEHWKDQKAAVQAPAGGSPFDRRYVRIIAAVTAWAGGYYLVLEPLGYIVATTIFLLALTAWFNRGKWIANVLSSVLFSAGSYFMFLKLDVNLPRGILPF